MLPRYRAAESQRPVDKDWQIDRGLGKKPYVEQSLQTTELKTYQSTTKA